MPLNPNANKNACYAIVRKLNDDGRPFASCDLISGSNPNDTEVIFNICEGPKVTIRDIEFTGNAFVSGGVLATHINSSAAFLHVLGGKFNQAMIESDIAKLEEYYRAFGFMDVRVAQERRYSPDG